MGHPGSHPCLSWQAALELAAGTSGVVALLGAADTGKSTFALAVAMPQILKSSPLEPWTGGVQGIVIIKPDAPFGLPLSGDQWLYFVTLAVGGALGIVLGASLLWTPPRRAAVVRWALAAIGLLLLGYASYLVVGLLATMRGLAAQPLAVPQLGPGLFVSTVGAALVAVAPWMRRRAAADGAAQRQNA